VKVQFGSQSVDVLTAGEVDDVIGKHVRIMRDWIVEAGRGPKPVRWTCSAPIDTNGNVSIGSGVAGSGRSGPDPSLVWSVKRITITGFTVDGDTLDCYFDAATPGRLVQASLPATLRIGSDELVVQGPEALLFVGTGLATPAGTVITVSGSAWELPSTLTYRLL
jgi:hypothetical protein